MQKQQDNTILQLKETFRNREAYPVMEATNKSLNHGDENHKYQEEMCENVLEAMWWYEHV